MKLKYKNDYTKLSDQQIVGKILAEPHDEEAAVYLLHDRYAPLLHNLYKCFTQQETWFDDCVDELFMHIKGKDCSWHTLATFEWRSTLGYWLKKVAWCKFKDLLPKMIENGGTNISIDNDDPEHPKIQISDVDEEGYERRQRRVMFMEAVRKLEDDDQRFVMFKRMEGYKSKEIADMLKIKWQKYGIVKYNNDNEIVIPDEGYVNVHVQRAKKELKKIMSN